VIVIVSQLRCHIICNFRDTKEVRTVPCVQVPSQQGIQRRARGSDDVIVMSVPHHLLHVMPRVVLKWDMCHENI
jgi:hypothetical protein